MKKEELTVTEDHIKLEQLKKEVPVKLLFRKIARRATKKSYRYDIVRIRDNKTVVRNVKANKVDQIMDVMYRSERKKFDKEIEKNLLG